MIALAENDLRMAVQDSFEVHLMHLSTLVLQRTRHDLQGSNGLHRLGTVVGLDPANDNIGTRLFPAITFRQHRERLADWRIDKVNPEPGRSRARFQSHSFEHFHGCWSVAVCHWRDNNPPGRNNAKTGDRSPVIVQANVSRF